MSNRTGGLNHPTISWKETMHYDQGVNDMYMANTGPTTRSSPVKTRFMNRQSSMIPQTSPQSSDVVLRPLPFYDQLYELIPLTKLQNHCMTNRVNESLVEFKLTIDQADMLAMNRTTKHVVLRFCILDPSSDQDDNFPPEVFIQVNGTQVVLPPAIINPNRPNVPPKRPGQHLEITKFCKLCPYVQNIIQVKWSVDPTDLMKQYAINIMIGDKITSDMLLQRIKERGLSDPECTRRLIADSDTEVATTNLQCSLVCPIGKMRISSPCKSIKCHHIPCFDALCYIQMNERKATWTCPVCNQPAYYPDLIIDGYFVDILDNASTNVMEVTLNLDGSWSPVFKTEQPSSARNILPEIITISDDDDE